MMRARGCACHATHTYLVQDLVGCWLERHGLFVYEVLLVELDGLAPIVEGAGDVDFFSWVLPLIQTSARGLSLARASRTNCVTIALPDYAGVSNAQVHGAAAEWRLGVDEGVCVC